MSNPADRNSLPPPLESGSVPGPVRQALAGQGALLGQHGQVLQALTAQVAEMSQTLANMLHLQAQTSPPVTSPPRTPRSNSPPPREPYVLPPEPYDGNLGTCREFLTQCSLVFDLQPRTYSTDRAKVAYLIGCLQGSARSWATAVWEKQAPITSSYSEFTAEMRKIFDHPVQGKDAAKRLLSLHQGPRSVTELAIEFRCLAAESGWNEEALHGVFQHALNENIKDELVSLKEPDGLDELISLSIRIDNRLRERRREKTGKVASASTPSTSPHFSPPTAPPPQSPPDTEPMQLGRAKLTPEERRRRITTKSCLYCGQSGHFLYACPLRQVKGVTQQ